MRRILLLFPHLLLLCYLAQAQPSITVAQEQFLKNRALSKVKVYTEYLELITLTNVGQTEERNMHMQTLFLTLGKDKSNTRVFNDLIPPEVLKKNPSFEPSVRMEPYLKSMTEHYGDKLKLSYGNLEVSDVFYNKDADWYFVRVTADRTIDGEFQHKAEVTPYKATDKVDFFVNASLKDGQMQVEGIYGAQPHDPNPAYTKARIKIGGDDKLIVDQLIGKPLSVNQETVQKKFKRGKPYTIEWDGGLKDDIIQVELVPEDTVSGEVRKGEAILNANRYTFIPSDEDKVGDYSLRIRNISTGKYAQTNSFKVRRKVPLGAILAGGAGVIAGVIVTVLSGGDGPEILGDPRAPNQPE